MKRNGELYTQGAFRRMMDLAGQRIKNDDIETSTALYKLEIEFSWASRNDQKYGDEQVIMSYQEMLKKLNKEFTAWDELNLPDDRPVTATNMGAESVFSIFKTRESQDTSICIANLWRTSIAKASKTGEWLANLESTRKQKVLSEALINRLVLEISDKTCNKERILEYLPEPTEIGKYLYYYVYFDILVIFSEKSK